MATVQLRTRVNRERKEKSAQVHKRLGLDASTFVSPSFAQLVNRRGRPFPVTEADADYFALGYSLTPTELAAGRRMRGETARAWGAGELREIGTAADLAP